MKIQHKAQGAIQNFFFKKIKRGNANRTTPINLNERLASHHIADNLKDTLANVNNQTLI